MKFGRLYCYGRTDLVSILGFLNSYRMPKVYFFVIQEVKIVVFCTVSAVLITLVNRNCVANHVKKSVSYPEVTMV